MFRPGENFVYDIFIFFVKIWWSILKLLIAAGYWLFRRRGAAVSASGERPQVSFRLPELANSPPLLKFALGASLAGAGIVMTVIAFGNLTTPYGRSNEVGHVLLLVSGMGSMGLGLRFIGLGIGEQSSQESLKTKDDPAPVPSIFAYSIRLPRKTEWKQQQALHFLDQLLFSLPYLVFQTVADERSITWQIVDLAYGIDPGVLEQLIRSSYPTAEVAIETVEPREIDSPFFRYTAYYQQLNMFVAPMLFVTDIQDVDPISSLTQAVTALGPGERVSYTLTVTGVAQAAYDQGQKLITQSTIHPLMLMSRRGVGAAMSRTMSGQDRTDKFELRDQKVFEDKLREKLYYAYLTVQIDAPSKERLQQILALVDTQMSYLSRMPYNGLHWVSRPVDQYAQWIETADDDLKNLDLVLIEDLIRPTKKRPQTVPRLILEPRELAAIWHLPHADCAAPRIAWASGMVAMPEAVAALEAGTLAGYGKYEGALKLIYLAARDRAMHLNIIGRTGTGKSTLMHLLINQDIARGTGVAVLDPHGKLVRDILRTSIPAEREQDVVVLDLSDERYPPPLNPLGAASSYSGTLRVVGLIERLFAGTESAARMSSYLRATLLPLQADPGATMRDVTRLFTDEVYREQLLNQTDDPETQDFWDYQFNLSTAALQRQIADPIINRIRPFYANPFLYPVLCHPDTIDFRALIREKKIILISLAMDDERVPEQERNLVGALVMSRLQMSGMTHATDDPYFIYVDEVQKFVTTSLPEMLSEARKYGLSLTTANQFLGQLSGRTLEAMMGNVGTTVLFRCSPEDTQALAAYTRPQFDAQQLVDLPRFQATVKLQVDGEVQPAFSLTTLPPLEQPEDGAERERQIRDMSIARYTPKSREEVLNWLKERYPRRRKASVVEPTEEASFYEP